MIWTDDASEVVRKEVQLGLTDQDLEALRITAERNAKIGKRPDVVRPSDVRYAISIIRKKGVSA